MARRAVGRNVHTALTAQSRSSVSVEAIVKQYLPLINKFAFKFGIGTDFIPDLVNTGVVGLLEAFKRFNPSKKARFGTYAYHYIRGAMLNYIKAEKSKGGIGCDVPVLLSFDEPLHDAGAADADRPATLHDAVGDGNLESALVAAMDGQRKRAALKPALEKLTPHERRVIRIVFFQDNTQRRAAVLMKVSEPRVSSLVHTSLKKLRTDVA